MYHYCIFIQSESNSDTLLHDRKQMKLSKHCHYESAFLINHIAYKGM